MAQLKDLVVSGDARVSGNLYHNNPSYGYGTCTTAADVAAKVVNTNDPTWTLTPGSVIVVKNTYTNTALNPTLNVNDTGDKSIWYDDFVITTSYLSMGGSASRPCMYVYDGTYYVWMAWSVDTDFAGTLATVATTGSYNDLSNKPTIPNQLSQLNDDTTHRVVTDTEKSTWNAKSDFSGSYNDLTDKPTIPVANDGTLTIQKNGSNIGTFTANQSTDETINIVVPTDYIDTAGTGLTKSGSTLSLTSGVVTAGTKGPTANVTGNEGNTIKVPKVTVDTYGRVTDLAEYTYTSKNTTYSNMTAASSSAAGTAGLVPAPASGKQGSFLRGDATWATPTNTTYSAGTGLSLSSTTFSLASGVVTAATKGATADVTGNNGNTIKVPKITVDTYGRVTGLADYTYTSVNTQRSDSSIVNLIYPVGSIYMSVNSTSPATLFGGTWVQLKDRFLLGAGDTYSNGSTSGAATHTHGLSAGYTMANAYGTSMRFKEKTVSSWTYNGVRNFSSSGSGSASQTYGWCLGGSTDSGSTMPPYLVVYMWKRTA